MNTKNGLTILAAAFIAISLVGCNKESSKGIVSVNGDAITNSELLEYLETKQTIRAVVNNQVGNVQVQDTLSFQAMQDLVIRKLVLQMAKSEGVLPNKAEIDAEIKLRDEISPNFLRTLQARGLSMKGIREQIEVELAQQKLFTKGIEVKDSEVDEYIKAKPQEFEEPAKAELYWIVTAEPSKAQVDAELARGTKFQDVAVNASLDPNAKRTSGKFQADVYPGGVPLVTLEQSIRTTIENTAPGKATGWIALPQQPNQAAMSAKFYVIRKTEAKKIEITEARRTWVKNQLAVLRGKQTKDIQQKLEDMMRKADIEVTDKTLKTLWEKFDEKLKEQADKTTIPNNTPTETN